ncbi:DUF2306 domain-containing protein [Amphritea japonica]|uniref:DUF2306 domain-containing protein n=1 Tax=Amphritea japonica ATCC BAA-1530 TaxID=1278309 RepID=A0A7R6STF8_9GAMM|nr:DUF2306 domain-containing protein [Amphritea japonica]BBB26567.1 conserved hypothetical protein [Amphritea japonica ATCC BAA-1530]
MHTYVHLSAATWVLVIGFLQLRWAKGTSLHKRLGWSWMLAMIIASISSFGITGFVNWFYGYGPIHLLSIWVLICVVLSVGSARRGNIRSHRSYAVGAYLGTIGAAVGAVLMPGRLLHMIFIS